MVYFMYAISESVMLVITRWMFDLSSFDGKCTSYMCDLHPQSQSKIIESWTTFTFSGVVSLQHNWKPCNHYFQVLQQSYVTFTFNFVTFDSHISQLIENWMTFSIGYSLNN